MFWGFFNRGYCNFYFSYYFFLGSRILFGEYYFVFKLIVLRYKYDEIIDLRNEDMYNILFNC